MEVNNLKKHIAETAYNVGYSAKLHFSSFEMIEKLPGVISFLSMSFGIYALAFSELSTEMMSCTLLVFGLLGLYISMKNSDKENYESKGIKLTGLFNELKHLMAEAEQPDQCLDSISNRLKDIENTYNQSCASHHLMFATWFAHYKFFWEQQTGWVQQYRPFGFFRDKIPLTLWVSFVFLLLCTVFSYPAVFELIGNVCTNKESK
jgi:hypothetical protein